jgi:hypothetical protein
MPALCATVLPLTLIVAASAVAYSTLTGNAPAATSTAAAPLASEPDLVVRGALARAGLAGPALAVAGLGVADVPALITRTQSSAVVRQNLLTAASQAAGEAKVLAQRLEDAVREGQHERLQEMQAARAALAAAEAHQADLIEQVFTAATTGLDQAVIARLRQVRENRRYMQLPLEFLVVARTETDWRALKDSLTHERVCTKLGEPTNAEVMQRLAAFRADEQVAAARARLDANLAPVEAAWNAAAVLPQ